MWQTKVFKVDTVTEETFIWPDNNSGVSHTVNDVLCMPYHVFFCNHQLGIVLCMVNLPLTYAGGSKAILMKLFDLLQQEWTLSVIPTRRPPSKTQGSVRKWGSTFCHTLRSSIKACDLENPRQHSCHSEKRWVCRTPCRALFIIK